MSKVNFIDSHMQTKHHYEKQITLLVLTLDFPKRTNSYSFPKAILPKNNRYVVHLLFWAVGCLSE